MENLVTVKSKTINNETVYVTLERFKPLTGENETRELTRPVVFRNFEATIPLKWAKILIKKSPEEYSIIGGDLKDKRDKKFAQTSQETVKGFKCEICGTEAKSNAGLSAHIRYNHPEKWESKK